MTTMQNPDDVTPESDVADTEMPYPVDEVVDQDDAPEGEA